MNAAVFEIRRAIENMPFMIRTLSFATSEHKLKWICLNSTTEAYDYSAFSQKLNVIKYRCNPEGSNINSIYLTVNKPMDDYILEIEFSDEKGIICEIPRDGEHKALLKELYEIVDSEIELSCARKVNSQLFAFAQSLSNGLGVV